VSLYSVQSTGQFLEMRVAVIIETRPGDGGAFQQAAALAELLIRTGIHGHSFELFTPHRSTRRALSRYGLNCILFPHRFIRHIDGLSATALGHAIIRRLRKFGIPRLGRHLDAFLEANKIDFVIFTDVTAVSLRVSDYPFVVTVMDLDHRSHPEFPEHYEGRRFQTREAVCQSVLARAVGIIVNSSSVANHLTKTYGVSAFRIIRMSLLPSLLVTTTTDGDKSERKQNYIRAKYKLPNQYIFYPAYYFFHKNHSYLFEAMRGLTRDYGIRLHAVMCGADPLNHFAAIKENADKLGVSNQILFLGKVPDDEISALYERAFVTVSPSPFGPTNLQQIEASFLGCAVICADLPDNREQMGAAALYCDLSDPTSLSKHLAALIHDPALKANLEKVGQDLTSNLLSSDYLQPLSRSLEHFSYLRRRWRER
jgi:glycosyltransferase involved in cell wall biosynthesis